MIVFDKVSKKFFNDSYGVKEVSFEVNDGELVLITGPTGSGKTTLMRLITKEFEPNGGQVLFNDLDLEEIKPALLPDHRRKIGVIFQDYRLLPESNVWENIALPLLIAGKNQDKIEERVTDLLRLVHLEEKADLFPRELSGGEAQRVSIARALATAPKVIFADEPTGNLDKDTSQAIIRLLKKINQLGTTVLLATHDVVVLDDLVDERKIELKNGRLITDSQERKITKKLKKPKVEKKKKEKSKNKKINLNKEIKIDKEKRPDIKSKFKNPFKKLNLKKKDEKKS